MTFTWVKFDEFFNFARSNVYSDGVVDFDQRIWITDCAAVTSHNARYTFQSNEYLLHFTQFVLNTTYTQPLLLRFPNFCLRFASAGFGAKTAVSDSIVQNSPGNDVGLRFRYRNNTRHSTLKSAANTSRHHHHHRYYTGLKATRFVYLAYCIERITSSWHGFHHSNSVPEKNSKLTFVM